MKLLYKLFFKLFYPLFKTLGRIYPLPLMTRRAAIEILDVIKEGDVLVSREGMRPTNVIVPGFWTHAAIYVGNREVSEATDIGCHLLDIDQFLYTKDHVAVLRPIFSTDYQKLNSCSVARSLTGRIYDYKFKFGNEAFYCAELVYHSISESMPNCPFTLRETLGELTVKPQDFFDAKDKFELIYLFDGKAKE